MVEKERGKRERGKREGKERERDIEDMKREREAHKTFRKTPDTILKKFLAKMYLSRKLVESLRLAKP